MAHDLACITPRQARAAEPPLAAPDFSCVIGRIAITPCHHETARWVNPGEEAERHDLIIPNRGDIRFCQHDRNGVVREGEYVLLNRAHFYEMSSMTGLDYWRITLPSADLKGRLSSIEDHVGKRFEQHGPMARLLRDFIATVAQTFAAEPPPNPEALATEIISLAMLALSAERREAAPNWRNSRYMLKQRIFEFIEVHLDDTELSPKKIAQANRISPSYLYSLFADNNTTVNQFIQARRLQKAYEMLVTDSNGALTVSEIAYLVGFKNASHFSRTFSRHFRIAPRDARQSGLAGRGA